MTKRPSTALLDVACCAAMAIYAITVVVTPVCLLEMAEEFGVGLSGGGGLELARTLLLLAMLLACGHVAARFGKVRSLAFACWTVVAGLLLLSVAGDYTQAVLCFMLIGLGSGVLEALINPLVQDLHPVNSGKALNTTNAFFSIGVLVGALSAGELLTRGASWRTIFQGLALAAAALAVLFHAGRRTPLPGSSAGWSHVADILMRPRFWWLGLSMLCAGATESAFTFWSASYTRLQFHASPRAGAVATALFAGGMAVGRLLTGHVATHDMLRRVILLSACGGMLVSIAVFLVESAALFYGVLLFAGLSVACFWPSIQAFAAQELPVDSTLLFILLSCFGIPGFGLAGWVMGLVGDRWGLGASFMLVPGLFALLAAAILAEQWVSRRRRER